MNKPNLKSFEVPLALIPRVLNKLHSLWLSWTYPFASVGHRLSIHYSCDLRRAVAGYMKIGNNVVIDRNARLDVPVVPSSSEPVIIIEDRCLIGQRNTILAINKIHIERNNLFGQAVFITDHNHEFGDVTTPIRFQGTTKGGTIRIEEGCWIGFGAAIICSQGELVIGRNSVVGANSVVTRSIPPYSVAAGNPCRIVKRFDAAKGEWVRTNAAPEHDAPLANLSQAR